MNSEQYVESVKQMMAQQNNFFAMFLAILAIVLTFAGILQWRLSNKQIQQLKEETRAETIADIEKILAVTDLYKFKDEVNAPLVDRIEKETKLSKDFLHYEHASLDLAFLGLYRSPFPMSDLLIIIDVYYLYLKRDIGNLNYFVSRVESLIENPETNLSKEGNLVIFKRITERLSDIESSFNQDSVRMENLKKKHSTEI